MGKMIRKNNSAEMITKLSKEFGSTIAKAGWFESSKYENGTPVAYVAAIQEYGVPERSLPARPFMRPTSEAQGKTWSKLLAKGAVAITKGTETAHSVLTKVSALAVADVQKTISEITSPALSPITIELRSMKQKDSSLNVTGATVGEAASNVNKEGYTTPTNVSTKPLVDSSILLSTMTSVVEAE